MNILEMPFVTQEQKFEYWEVSKSEIKELQAKLNIAIDALDWISKVNAMDYEFVKVATEALSKIKE